MDGTGPQQPLSDSQLDRELESALGIEPSPQFLARIRARVAAEPEAEPWRLAIRRWSFEPLVGVALAGIVLAVVVPNLMRSGKRSEPGVTVARHVDGPIQEVVEEPPPVAGERVVVPVARSVVVPAAPSVGADVYVGLSRDADNVHTLPLQLSEPLFSEEDRRLFRQYYAAVEEGRVPPRVAETQQNETAGVAQTLAIEPLTIDPLPLLVTRTQAEGEAKW